MEHRNTRLFLLLIYLALAVYLLPIFPQADSANDLARWATAVSLVENNSFEISWAGESLIGKTAATAGVGENVYSDKPPGVSLLAAPIYALTKIFLGPPTQENMRISWFVMRFFISTLPLFFLAAWLYQKDTDTFSLAALLFATPLFIYSLLFFSHVLVAVLIYLVFRLLFDVRRGALRNCLWAGFLSGFAITCELAAAVPLLIFGAGLFFTEPRDRYRRLFFYGLGLLPGIALLLTYNSLIFGAPLAFSGGVRGISGFGIPTLADIFLSIFSPSRGLFFFSPILIFSIVTFFTSREHGTLRKRIKIITIILSLLILPGYVAAAGTWVFGAGHLILIVPLLLDSFFDGETEEYPSLWRGFLFGISFLLCTLPVLTFSFVPTQFSFPHNTLWRPLLFDDQWFAPTILSLFNFPNNIWTILPVALLLLLALYFVWRRAKIPLNFLIGILSAVLAVGIYIFVPGFDKPEFRAEREKIVREYR